MMLMPDLRHPLFTLTVYLYTLILLPLLHSLWLLTGTGNANFFYAASMVHGLNTCLAIVDVVGAGIRHHVKQAVQAIDGEPWNEAWEVIQLNSVAS
jgi:phosphatidylinositol glycan class U